jgi:hypothetical protein
MDTFFGSSVQRLPLFLGNMHIGLASVNPEVRDVRFITKPQKKT